ncbi:alpha/beta fold hydrolase [Arthrobacter sp. zg-Y750]|uniref:alpha/beta fold hydrolase n=1 Tax=Arthrobacter sp. zg-Y750 TaxID=2894189 RepID=UPI001E54935E|nr:thioesterase domain-containing protein [Arthrobacter sp. zg-Y750]MCC9177228.1 alpha/beta fold hydrolase [Arthrobacter sp. zg-Y750]
MNSASSSRGNRRGSGDPEPESVRDPEMLPAPGTPGDPGAFLRKVSDLHRISRRRFLAGSAAGLLLATDLAVTSRIQRYREELEILRVPDKEAQRRFPRAMWFLFPGYKISWEETRWILGSLRPALTTRGQLAAVGYSNLGLRVQDILDAVHRCILDLRLERIYFYGHSFGGMVAVQVAAGLRERGVAVELIILDSSPSGKKDVLDRAMFEGAVFLYDAGYRVPLGLRGGYELGERLVHKDERSWRTIGEQTLAQLSPLAPSSTLIQSQASFIYHFSAARFTAALAGTKAAFIGNPRDETVNSASARAGWTDAFGSNLLPGSPVTEGARPAHASPQWNPEIYEEVLLQVLRLYEPAPSGGVRPEE